MGWKVFLFEYSERGEEIKEYIRARQKKEEYEYQKLEPDDYRMCGYHGFEWYDNKGMGYSWDNYEEHVLSVSRRFPNVLITVKINGKEWDDRRVQYFKGGRCTDVYKANIQVTYTPFDPDNLE